MEQHRCYGCMEMITEEVCPHCGYSLHQNNHSNQLPVGTMLRDQYLVGRVLGQGGFGITYIGWDTYLEEPVAIKEFFPTSAVSRDSALSQTVRVNATTTEKFYSGSLDRFLREAKTLAKLRNIPEIVGIMSFFPANNTAYIIMEYVQGTDLRRYAKRRGGKLPADELLAILEPVAKALDAVHKAGLVHRDISPDNIMIRPDGTPKLLDFGAVRDSGSEDADIDLSHSTEAILKHGFAPVEQYRARGNLGPWTDEYGFCASIYYCLTGQVPPDALARMTDDLHPDWQSAPGLTPQQRFALEKGMSIRAKDRFGSMKALCDELYSSHGEIPVPAAASSEEYPMTSAPSRPSPVREKASKSQPPAPKSAAPLRKKSILPLIIGIAAAVALISGISLLPGKNDTPEFQADVSAPVTESTLSAEDQRLRQQYSQAGVWEQEGQLSAAAMAFAELGDYQDSRQRSFAIWDRIARRDTVDSYDSHAIAIRNDGTVLTCGFWGNLNIDTSGWTDIIAVSTGSNFAVGLRSDGTVVATGNNDNGQCEVSQWTDIVAISCGWRHTVGLRADGTVVAAGSLLNTDGNYSGECDVDIWQNMVSIATSDHLTVGVRRDGTVWVAGSPFYWNQTTVASWRDIVDVSMGWNHIVGLKADGTVVCEGNNEWNQCLVSDWTDILSVSTGTKHTLGLKADGTVVAAGSNRDMFSGHSGQLDVHGWTDITSISAGHIVTLGLKADGTPVVTGKHYGDLDGVSQWTDIRQPKVPESPLSDVPFPAPDVSEPWEANVLSADALDLLEPERWKYTSVTFLDSTEGAPADAVDVSADRSGRVLAWYTPNGNMYDLFLAGDGGINGQVACHMLFYSCGNVTEITFGNAFHTEYAASMENMFHLCRHLEKVDTENLNTSGVISMYRMFDSCDILRAPDISGWDVSNVQNMKSMFAYCTNLSAPDIGNWDVSRVTNMSQMFKMCSGIKDLDLSRWELSQVTDYSEFSPDGILADGISAWQLFNS